jgi:hypothetical protein
MLQAISTWWTSIVQKAAQKPYLITSFILLIAFNILMSAPGLPFSAAELEKISGGYGPLDITFGYSPATIDRTFSAYGEAGKTVYARYQLLDLFFPAIYSVFLGGLLFRLFGGRGGVLALAYYLPLGGALFDYVENMLLWSIARSHPDIPTWIATLAPIITITKFIFPLLACVALISGGVRWLQGRAAGAATRKSS